MTAEAHLPQGGTITLQAKCLFVKLKSPAVLQIYLGVTVVLRLHPGELLPVCVTVTVPRRQGEITPRLANPSCVNQNQFCL